MKWHRAASRAAVVGAAALLAAAARPATQTAPDPAQPVAPDATGGAALAAGEAPTAAPAPPPPRAYDGSLGAGLAEVRRLAEAGDADAALAVADRLLAPDLAGRARAWLEARSGASSERALALFDDLLAPPLRALGLDPGTAAERAEVHFARGVALRRAERPEEAAEAFALVRALGGAARLDAVYELGHLALLDGERWRAQIPELAAQQGSPAPPQVPADPKAPDPLEEARRAYRRALDVFVERLRLDWRDADTRANVELVRRRLRELDELERRREEQQQDQPSEDPQQKPDPKQEPDESEQGEPQEPEEGQESQEGEPEEEPQEGEQEPQEGEPRPEEAQEAEPRPEEPPQATEEANLTKEELQRLLQQLREHRELGEEVQRALRQRARSRAARDW